MPRDILSDLKRVAERQTITEALDEAGAAQQTATRTAEVMPPPPPKRRTRGREATKRRIRDYSPQARKVVDEWLTARCAPMPENILLIGSPAPITHTLMSGRRVRALAAYEHRTLVEDMTEFCRARGWPMLRLKGLTGYVLEACVARNWPVVHGKSSRRRRSILIGIAIQGQPHWNGDEYGAPRYDMKKL